MSPDIRRVLHALILALGSQVWPASDALAFSTTLFGFSEAEQGDTEIFGQWIEVLERHLLLDTPRGECTETRFNRCHLAHWRNFLEGLRETSRKVQIEAVNRYANEKNYVLDIDNYGLEDYWAVAREFLYNDGDCEDYALTKLFSLLWLGYAENELRIVVLQDTNLRVPHAVLAVADGEDILILDNQIEEVISHRQIVHYVPVYSINEQSWWLHLPR